MTAIGPEARGAVSGTFNVHFNAGNKALSRNGQAAMREFAQWVMAQEADVIIAGGHSLWFKEFFKAYLPHANRHEAKKKKMVNCGVVAFDFTCAANNTVGLVYRIDPASITTLYGGFGAK